MRQTTISIGYSVVALISLPLGTPYGLHPAHTRVHPVRLLLLLQPGPLFDQGTCPDRRHDCRQQRHRLCGRHRHHPKAPLPDQKPFIAGLLLVSTTQVTGFAMAGALRKLLIQPAHMLWPSTLVTASLFRSLHVLPNAKEDRGKVSQMKYFMVVTLGMFVYNWFPGLIFPLWACSCGCTGSIQTTLTCPSWPALTASASALFL